MSEYSGPVPVPTPETRPFWEAARRHELSLQRCRACGAHVFYPRAACLRCLVVELDEGPRMMTNLVGIAPDPAKIKIGMAVEVVFEDVSPEIALPRFRPA